MRRGAPAALPQGWACASEGRLWILKEPREPARPQRESEAGIQPRACARGAGRRGWAVRGAGGGVGDRKGSASWFQPRGANRARLRAAGRSCLSAAPSSRPRPLSSSRPPRRAARCWQPSGGARAESRGSRRVGSRGLRASVPLFIPPGLCRRARGERDRETAVQRAGQPTGPRAGPRAPEGAMSYQGKKSIPHITVSRAPPRPAVPRGMGVVAARVGICRGTRAAPEAF